ncbi:hypothetical protein Tsubulata_014600 [Turnera subulata]|uniref:Uncharacterized protein n=1 Tax=Turnera subulata TaxID=218843 RepID=A0A9Q0GBQ5_9ROSI|nr:hypothetical protein Tsubulata_014600 [Turnera subulata]
MDNFVMICSTVLVQKERRQEITAALVPRFITTAFADPGPADHLHVSTPKPYVVITPATPPPPTSDHDHHNVQHRHQFISLSRGSRPATPAWRTALSTWLHDQATSKSSSPLGSQIAAALARSLDEGKEDKEKEESRTWCTLQFTRWLKSNISQSTNLYSTHLLFNLIDLIIEVVVVVQIFFPRLITAPSTLGYSVVGALLFSGYMVLDTYKLIERFRDDQYIIAATLLYLDIINLFVQIMRIVMEAEERKNRNRRR